MDSRSDKPLLAGASLAVLVLSFLLAAALYLFGTDNGGLAVSVPAIAGAFRGLAVLLAGTLISLLLAAGSHIKGENKRFSLILLFIDSIVTGFLIYTLLAGD